MFEAIWLGARSFAHANAATMALLLLVSCSEDVRYRHRDGVPPAGELVDSASEGSTCAERSFQFRKRVGACFSGHALCNHVLSVLFDQDGVTTRAEFLTGTAGQEQATQVASTLSCVRGRLAELNNPCSRSRAVQFKLSCTLR